MRFFDGDRVNLYAFPQTKHKIGCYWRPDGQIKHFEDFTLRQTEYFESKNGVWLSSAWQYDLPFKEGQYYVGVISKKDVWYGISRTLVESLGEIRNAKGELVGYCVNESMDLKNTKTGPYNNVI